MLFSFIVRVNASVKGNCCVKLGKEGGLGKFNLAKLTDLLLCLGHGEHLSDDSQVSH